MQGNANTECMMNTQTLLTANYFCSIYNALAPETAKWRGACSSITVLFIKMQVGQVRSPIHPPEDLVFRALTAAWLMLHHGTDAQLTGRRKAKRHNSEAPSSESTPEWWMVGLLCADKVLFTCLVSADTPAWNMVSCYTLKITFLTHCLAIM